ncbi:MAG: HAD hydrolase-like protein [Anaerovoracaceae bacterium]
MTRKYEAVLFDFDGTIMNTNDIILESWQHTFRTVDGAERPFEDIAPTLGEPLRLTMSKFFPGRDPEDMVAIYRSYQQQVYQDQCPPVPGRKVRDTGAEGAGLPAGTRDVAPARFDDGRPAQVRHRSVF